MKQIAIIALLIGLSAFTMGQKTAMEYFAKLPDIPGNCCAMDDSSRVWYMDNLREVSNEISEDAHARTEALNEFMEAHRGEAEVNAMKNAGFEGMDVEKLKKMDTKHMSEEQKTAMADQLMQQYMNMSMEEVKKLKSYDTAGQRRWAQAYSTERMADQSADPEKLKKDQLRNKSMFDLQQKLKYLNDVMNARWDKYTQMFDTLKKEADTARADLDRRQRPLYAQLDSGDLDDSQREAILDQIYRQNFSHCQQYNPEYCKILFEYKTTLFKTLMKADYDTLENVQHESIKYQTGLDDPSYEPGLFAIQAVQRYATLLGTVFIYSVGNLNRMRISGAE
jgi:hypothetical protein